MKPIDGLDKLQSRPVIVKWSGGKDSTALIEALIENGVRPHTILNCDTGWEALEHYDHIEREKQRILSAHGLEVTTVMLDVRLDPELLAIAEKLEAEAGLGVSPMIRRAIKNACFSRPGKGPGGGKWCTSDLKIRPAGIWYEAQEWDSEPVFATGVRRDESRSRAASLVWEQQKSAPYLDEWRPLAAWSVRDVADILTRHRVPVHPLYQQGCDRVGCWPCIHAGKAEIERISKDALRVEVVRKLERIVTELSNGERGIGWFQSKASVNGEYPPVPIEQAILWSKTSHGGKQFSLWARPVEDTCARWGWCEV